MILKDNKHILSFMFQVRINGVVAYLEYKQTNVFLNSVTSSLMLCPDYSKQDIWPLAAEIFIHP